MLIICLQRLDLSYAAPEIVMAIRLPDLCVRCVWQLWEEVFLAGSNPAHEAQGGNRLLLDVVMRVSHFWRMLPELS